MALVFAALLTAGFAPLIAIPLDCMILGFPIELSSIGFTLSVDNTIWWWINVGPHCVPGCLASFALFLSVSCSCSYRLLEGASAVRRCTWGGAGENGAGDHPGLGDLGRARTAEKQRIRVRV